MRTLSFRIHCEGRERELVLPAFRLNATVLLEYAYCPRFVFFENFMQIPEHQEKRFKVQKGREVHEEKGRINKQYLRKKLGCEERFLNVRLHDAQGFYSGEPDEILLKADGSVAPLDYKWSKWKGKVHQTYQWQLLFYGLLIAENLERKVHCGHLVYVRSQNKVIDVSWNSKEVDAFCDAIRELHEIQEHGYFPEAAKYSKQCVDCCYRKICPRV